MIQMYCKLILDYTQYVDDIPAPLILDGDDE